MQTNVNTSWQEDQALNRYQLIAPLLGESLDAAKLIQLREDIAAKNDVSSLIAFSHAFVNCPTFTGFPFDNALIIFSQRFSNLSKVSLSKFFRIESSTSWYIWHEFESYISKEAFPADKRIVRYKLSFSKKPKLPLSTWYRTDNFSTFLHAFSILCLINKYCHSDKSPDSSIIKLYCEIACIKFYPYTMQFPY